MNKKIVKRESSYIKRVYLLSIAEKLQEERVQLQSKL